MVYSFCSWQFDISCCYWLWLTLTFRVLFLCLGQLALMPLIYLVCMCFMVFCVIEISFICCHDLQLLLKWRLCDVVPETIQTMCLKPFAYLVWFFWPDWVLISVLILYAIICCIRHYKRRGSIDRLICCFYGYGNFMFRMISYLPLQIISLKN